MTRKRIQKLRQELDQLRAQRSSLGRRELEGFAKKLGRQRRPKGRGEPQWVSKITPSARPVSIPGHKSINAYTASAILDCFENDLDQLEELAE